MLRMGKNVSSEDKELRVEAVLNDVIQIKFTLLLEIQFC
jgi:hypothetical protein